MNSNLMVGAVSTLIGVAYTIQTLRTPKATIGSPWAPLMFPLGLGILMTVFGVCLVIGVLLKDRRIFTEEKKPVNKDFLILASATIIGTCVYAYLFDRIGFIISTLLFMGFMMFMINGRKQWVRSIIVTAAFTFGIWYAFTGLLKVSLP